MRGRNVDDVVAEWAAELQQRSRSFSRAADALASWDSAVLAARGALLEQEARVARAARAQAALERKLGLLEAHQREVHEALGSMEAAAAAAYADELRPAMVSGGGGAGFSDRDAAQRDALYERAEAIAAALARAGDDLRGAIADVNASAAVASGGASVSAGGTSSALALSSSSSAAAAAAADPSSSSAAPLPKLVKVLNNQLHALSSLDEKCEQLEARLRALPGAAAVAAAAAAQAAASSRASGTFTTRTISADHDRESASASASASASPTASTEGDRGGG